MDLSYVPVKYSRTKLDYLDSLKGNFKVTRSFMLIFWLYAKLAKEKYTHTQAKQINIYHTQSFCWPHTTWPKNKPQPDRFCSSLVLAFWNPQPNEHQIRSFLLFSFCCCCCCSKVSLSLIKNNKKVLKPSLNNTNNKI